MFQCETSIVVITICIYLTITRLQPPATLIRDKAVEMDV